MKIASYLLLIIFIAFFSSCEKDEDFVKKSLELPERTYNDLDDDSIIDITIYYNRFWSLRLNGSGADGEGIVGSLEPLNNCSILKKEYGLTFFNKVGDVIRREPGRYFWAPTDLEDTARYYWDAVSIYSSYDDETWPDEWSIESDLDLDYYYMGIRITDESNDQIGWIKLDIDKSTGIINIIDKRFTTDDSIVISE